MVGGSIVLGITLIGLATYLHLQYGLQSKQAETTDVFMRRRHHVRTSVHALMFVCGFLMLVTVFVAPGLVWAGIWTGIVALLFIIIVLALFDALNSHREHTEQLRAIQREYLGPIEGED